MFSSDPAKRYPYFIVTILIATLCIRDRTGVAKEAAFHPSGPPGASSSVTFHDFNGVVYLPGPEMTQQLGIGWAREGFLWGHIEPKKGQWKWEKTDQIVQGAHAQGVEILPLLAYTAFWAVSIAGKEVSPAQYVEDWENFVEHAVARYSSPPFNLRYFQVWNEPTRQAGFWTGTHHEFIDKIYLPAAKIIRRHNCYVVFGGWPLSNSLEELDETLAYQGAWQWTDILDVHYWDVFAWQHLYDKWVKTGKCRGIWQTEIGFTDDPKYLPNLYLRVLHWALQSGWKDPNQYKVFWYAHWGAGPDGEKCLTKTDAHGKTVLTQNGKRLALMNDVLGKGSLALFTQFSTTPPLPLAPTETVTALGFRVGENRVVIAFLLDSAAYQKYPSISVTVSLKRKPKRVELVYASGERRALTADYHTGHLQVRVPMGDVQTDRGFAIAYLLID